MTPMPRIAATGALLAAALAAVAGCGSSSNGADVCANRDGSLDNAAFVFVRTPVSGARVTSGFRVSGCSSTFEATLDWTLRAADGRGLAHGVAQGGALAPGQFTFDVDYTLTQGGIGQLEVAGTRGSASEGFPPPRDVVPLVLGP